LRGGYGACAGGRRRRRGLRRFADASGLEPCLLSFVPMSRQPPSVGPVVPPKPKECTMPRLARLTLSPLFLLFALACSSGGAGAPGYGARCTGDADCGGQTPSCAGGFCVECANNAACPSGDPICNGDGFCAECRNNADCGGGDPFCDTDRQRCVECRINADCGAAEPQCDRGSCRPMCASDADCDVDELCHPAQHICVRCVSNSDCPADKPICDQDRGRCRECTQNAHCGAAEPFCIDSECRECIQNTDCPTGQLCNRDLRCE